MTRDVINPHPHLARVILAVGVAVHFVACMPLYGRRGFPEVDPFWLAMIWLWIPAVFVSAAFDHWALARERDPGRPDNRLRDLVFYAVATGFAVSWGTVMMVPSYKTAAGALFGLIFYAPTMIVGVVIVEALSQALWSLFRQLTPRLRCERCRYSLYGLTEPRCPECGTQFSPELLSPDRLAQTTHRKTGGVIVIALFCSAAFPLVYRHGSFAIEAASGRHRAEQAWASGDFFLYRRYDDVWVDSEDLDAFIENVIDADTGFRIEFHTAPSFHSFRGYNGRVLELIAEHGLPQGTMKDHVVDDAHLVAMMDSPGFVEIIEFPHQFSPAFSVERERNHASRVQIVSPGHWHSYRLDKSDRCSWRVSDRDPEVVFIRMGNKCIMAYQAETGTLLANATR